jgi:hypothetical protein
MVIASAVLCCKSEQQVWVLLFVIVAASTGFWEAEFRAVDAASCGNQKPRFRSSDAASAGIQKP